MIRPEISALFERLTPQHQALCLELIELQSRDFPKYGSNPITMEDFFYEIIVSYLAGIFLRMTAEEIERNQDKARQLSRVAKA